jgi:GH25 family lysozyme M1 (1,4-beta-N-acetylmuramidase)
MKLVVDTNSYHEISAAELKACGAVALITKATEATAYKSPVYEAQRAVAKAAAVPFGAYTYIHWNDPGEQYRYFLEYAAPKRGDIQPAVDAEDPKADVAELARRSYACLVAFEAQGYRPLLYASSSVWKAMFAVEPRLKRFRVWEAQYPGRFARWFPRLSALRIALQHGATVVLWQWTDEFQVDGKTFDCSRALVNIKSLLIA